MPCQRFPTDSIVFLSAKSVGTSVISNYKLLNTRALGCGGGFQVISSLYTTRNVVSTVRCARVVIPWDSLLVWNGHPPTDFGLGLDRSTKLEPTGDGSKSGAAPGIPRSN
jgi:hypothetical protein